MLSRLETAFHVFIGWRRASHGLHHKPRFGILQDRPDLMDHQIFHRLPGRSLRFRMYFISMGSPAFFLTVSLFLSNTS